MVEIDWAAATELASCYTMRRHSKACAVIPALQPGYLGRAGYDAEAQCYVIELDPDQPAAEAVVSFWHELGHCCGAMPVTSWPADGIGLDGLHRLQNDQLRAEMADHLAVMEQAAELWAFTAQAVWEFLFGPGLPFVTAEESDQ